MTKNTCASSFTDSDITAINAATVAATLSATIAQFSC